MRPGALIEEAGEGQIATYPGYQTYSIKSGTQGNCPRASRTTGQHKVMNSILRMELIKCSKSMLTYSKTFSNIQKNDCKKYSEMHFKLII